MPTAKNIVFIGLYLENCCLVMGWGGDKNLVGVTFLVGGNSLVWKTLLCDIFGFT